MATRFSEFQRLRAAHAISTNRFCLAIHELEVDDQFSIILEYDGAYPQPWTRVEVLRNISGVSARADATEQDRPYVAVSDEGDVFFLGERGIVTEKIRGAGIYSDDADGSGAINGISIQTGDLFAFGFGGQVYRREGDNHWIRLALSDVQASKCGNFAFFCGGHEKQQFAGGSLAAEFQKAPDELREERRRAAAAGDFDKFQELSKQIESWKEDQGIVRIPTGILLAGSPDTLTRIEIPSNETLTAIHIASPDQIWIVGTGGLILHGNARDGFKDVSFHGDRDKNLVSVTKFRDRMVIASDYALHWFDGHILTPLKPKLSPFINKGVPTPLKVQAVDDVLFYFDYKHGVHRYDGENWEEIVIPPELLEREFKGLPSQQ
jgi:photosystem II stability/assembly factor-like uncharacterized protein